MTSKEKNQPITKADDVFPKSSPRPERESTDGEQKQKPVVKQKAMRKRAAVRNVIKKAIQINLKVKNKRRGRLPKQLVKNIKTNPEIKKVLIKNGIRKTTRKWKRKRRLNEEDDDDDDGKKEDEEESEDKINDREEEETNNELNRDETNSNKKKDEEETEKETNSEEVEPKIDDSKCKSDESMSKSDETNCGTDEDPPVLEAIYPINTKKQPRKKAIKLEKLKPQTVCDDPIGRQEDEKKTTRKNIRLDSAKTENIEDVINDLNYLINSSVDKESDSLSESGKSDVVKPKRTAPFKKGRLDSFKKKLKKENIENSFEKSETNVIEMLDLNVKSSKVNKTAGLRNRRHSIEKFPVGSDSGSNVFSNLPRSISPRNKRGSKLRGSVEGITRRSSPYTTRSDTPTKILRNGKQRKMKHSNLLEGLDAETRKRKRQCSDYSGSEISKNSGYDSDSSFSDLSSVQGSENADVDSIKKECLEPTDIKIKRSLSTDSSNGIPEVKKFDTNSNLCVKNEEKSEDFKPILTESDYVESVTVSPSTKVPEKSLILDIMKQTFNDVCKEEDKKKIKEENRGSLSESEGMSTAQFYGIVPSVPPLIPKTEEEAASEAPEICENTPPNEESKVLKSTETEEENLNKREREDTGDEDSFTLRVEESPRKQKRGIKNSKRARLKEEDEENDEKEKEIVANEKNPIEKKNLEGKGKPISNENKRKRGRQSAESNTKGRRSLKNIAEETLEDKENLEEEKSRAENVDLKNVKIEESPEELAVKENILQALGLQSLRAAEEAKLKQKEKSGTVAVSTATSKGDGCYTGTLKTVIKLNRTENKKKGRSSLKMTLQKNKSKTGKETEGDGARLEEEEYKIAKDSSSGWKPGAQSSDTAGALRKSHYSNRSNMDGSSEHTSDGDVGANEEVKSLVIPEKASSFSVHPGRLCKDECSYCLGKFGLFDTPCHIAQMKSVERQNKILAAEPHLARDSCLCDACFRQVDRKTNMPSYANKMNKRNSLVTPGPKQNQCQVSDCKRVATNILRRKWIIKMKKSINHTINLDLENPGVHSIPICKEHYQSVEHLMICPICKRRLARNHVNYLGPEFNNLNKALNDIGIPVKLNDKPVVCKLCRYFAGLALKDPSDLSENGMHFFREYKKRLLHFHDVQPMEEEETEEPISMPTRGEKGEKEQPKKKRKYINNNKGGHSSSGDEQPPVLEPQVDVEHKVEEKVDTEEDEGKKSRVSSTDSRSDSPSDYMVDYNTLVPSIAMECGSDQETAKPQQKQNNLSLLNKITSPGKNIDISKDVAVQRLGSNPSISVRQLFPGEEELPLEGRIEFGSVKERTPEGWEKCLSVVQYDNNTKLLWQELQKPYGNQSSFLRHLILLEKYFRNGDLILSPNASHHAINYSESVQNRLRAYDNVPSSAFQAQPPVQFSKIQKTVTVTNAANIPKSTPITISQLNNSNVIIQAAKPKPTTATPPSLVPLQNNVATVRPPAGKQPQSQKIKFPITKNWRPTLIPIDPTKKDKKAAGLVQVISGGKPYHITLEDYKKMCAIKRTFDLRQKRLQEVNKVQVQQGTSVLKPVTLKKTVLNKPSTVTGPDDQEDEEEKSEDFKTNDGKLVLLPKIPKSLTVIPQVVPRKPSRPSSPVLLITQKPKSANGKS